MDKSGKTSISDDEEDLEALRLAALQTLKKNAGPSHGAARGAPNDIQPPFRSGHRQHRFNFGGKRGRYYSGRSPKNGQFHNNRTVSSNLISLTPSVSREDLRPKQNDLESTLKLSQDKYVNSTNTTKPIQDEKTDEFSSKFDRYKDLDKSDEEEDSEDEILKSDSDIESSPLKLERSDSLEALMQELDNEIQGKGSLKEEEEVKVKEVVVEKEVQIACENENKEEIVPEQPEVVVVSNKDDDEGVLKASITKPTSSIDKKLPDTTEPLPKKRRYSPPMHKQRERHFRRSPPLQNPPPFIPSAFHPPVYNPPFIAPPFAPLPPPFYERPISPLLIDTESLQNQTMAPLSPRSAAFVLENRAIIEKRKRSPRRSFSRSPSPRKRLPSPVRRNRSPLSPRRRSLSPVKNRSRSPKRRSMSPRRRSPSPKRRPQSPKIRAISPKRRSPSPRKRSLSPRRRDRKEPVEGGAKPKLSVRDRLGFKASLKPEEKSGSNESVKSNKLEDKLVQPNSPSNLDNTPLDPILEARKKKFETGEIKGREGVVIRLKPKEEIDQNIETSEESKLVEEKTILNENDNELLQEDVLLADDELDIDMTNNLFSDEESGSEGEGRFKEKQEVIGEKPMVMPFAKLINGTIKETRATKLNLINKEGNDNDRKLSSTVKIPSRPSQKHSKIKLFKADKTSSGKNKLGVKSERHPKKFERKIEIKIKNLSKYEKGDGERIGKGRSLRKVEMGKSSKELEEEDDDTEIIVENDDDDNENTANGEGDLRAQLSKKRAEKMQKTSNKTTTTTTTREAVSSRLLQSALQNVLPLKKKKKSKSKELSSSGYPNHSRLRDFDNPPKGKQ